MLDASFVEQVRAYFPNKFTGNTEEFAQKLPQDLSITIHQILSVYRFTKMADEPEMRIRWRINMLEKWDDLAYNYRIQGNREIPPDEPI